VLQLAVVSTFYPNTAMPLRTLFVRNLVVALAEHAAVSVVAPIPYAPPFPTRSDWARFRSVSRLESRDGLSVQHPRFIAIPGMDVLNGWHYCWAVLPSLWSLRRSGKLDVIHVHCAYPDAVGVALAARILKLPFVVTAHGSDINVYARRPMLRRQLRWALRRASGVIAVSARLRHELTEAFPEIADRVEHIPCAGADPQIFRPLDRAALRRDLGLAPEARVALFIGQLVQVKRVDLLLEAWRQVLASGICGAQDRLLIIGEGPLRAQLGRTVENAQFQGTVSFLGGIPQSQIPRWLNAADLLCLASDNEGTPNVVVESLSVGRPVVATAVGGIPDLISPDVNGVLASAGDSRSLAAALTRALARTWDGAQIAAGMAAFSWQALARRNLAVLERAAGGLAEVAHASDQ
jgi:teichuronic acid biosynthesis glycosyltransferase TuaC